MRVLVCALGVLATATVLSAASDEVEHIAKVARIEPGGTLRLKNFAGRVKIAAADRNDVAIDAVRHGTRERLDRIKLDVHNEGSTLVVDANHKESDWYDWFGRKNSVVETDFDLKVPRHINLDVNVFSSPVTIEGVDGTHRLNGFSSVFHLIDIAGPIQAHTFSGSIEIRTRTWLPQQSIDINTFSGSVELHIPDTATASVSFNSFSGHLNSDMPLTFHSQSRRALTAQLGSPGPDAGTVRVKTFSGSVRIDR
jgi:hypothetical protein